MTLRSTVRDLRAHADVANDEHQVQRRTGRLADLSARLRPALMELPKLNIGLAEVQQLDVELPPGRDQEAAQLVEDLLALAAELPSMSIEQKLDLANARVRSAEKYVSELRTLVTGAWEAYVDQPLSTVNSELVEALAQGGLDVEEIRDALETARGHLFALSNRRIPNKGDVERFRTAIAAVHNCGEKLGDVVDADIAEGIVKSQEETGLPLRWFTPERLENLASLGIIDRFQVRLW